MGNTLIGHDMRLLHVFRFGQVVLKKNKTRPQALTVVKIVHATWYFKK